MAAIKTDILTSFRNPAASLLRRSLVVFLRKGYVDWNSKVLHHELVQAPLFRPAEKEHSPEVEKLISGLLENELATMEMQGDAKAQASPSAILTPAVPLPATDAAGWFGGAPRLPKDLAWPEIKGTPLCFVAQIDLT